MAFGKRARPTQMDSDSLSAPPLDADCETIIDAGSVLAGELHFSQNVRLDGRIEGQIVAGKHVVVGEEAQIDATIDAQSIEVYGTIVGDVRVAHRTILHKSARIEGEIHTAGIVVEEGARFRGVIVIGPDGDEPAPTAEISDVPSLAEVREKAPQPDSKPGFKSA